ncbi:hypothetical protein NQ314_013328 [Rhamnusium bicolor]|uniref:Dynein heavy chain linker domain-containing protein n=1 Tax=Rhamnusium bicolor TaxID=1586634 RepID=A0AAV8X8Z1_9CUCU|nr:hypothetical protein NQ314_013328 [Rhamnusium bicolor]
MNETCIICIPVKLADGQEFTHSFFEEVIKVHDVNDVYGKVSDAAQKAVLLVNRHLQKWKRYKSLWSYDKVSTCEKFITKNSTLSLYEEKFMFYNDIIENIKACSGYIDAGSIRLNLRPLLFTINFHSVEWKNTLGTLLDAWTKARMDEMKDKIDHLTVLVRQNIKGLERFKAIMQAISTIQRSNISAELDYLCYQQTYTILSMYGIYFPPENEAMSYQLEKDWKALLLSALYREQTLESTKDRFAGLTFSEINEFCDMLVIFLEKYEREGPGAVGEDLDLGIKLMDEYKVQFQELEERRIELVNAEMLFDIPLADYSDYLKAKSDFESMEVLYKLYKSLKYAREVWGKTLWANLNPQALVDGIDGFMKDYRKLPKNVRTIPVGLTLELKMKQFKNVVPLMVALKNEALRERHWRQLMVKTGIEFDMSPERFTLDNMFSMELHRYQDMAEEIINNAIKELSIEKGVKEIAEVWGAISFILFKHMKGIEDRGFIVGPTDEIMQVLDDNSMNLQSMAGSQFVGPFLPQVQKWEKSLANIGEVIDEWLSVQRKWLYLEGIFVGGDIRAQLPDEAKKFDDIDKAFRRIMLETAKKA